MKQGVVILTVALAFASSVHAAPGDPRLVQGVLEWPATLTAEPFLVVRTDDGKSVYTEIKAAKHLESAPLTAGARITVLGSEATQPHKIIAVAFGPGDVTALALRLLPYVNSATVAAGVPPTAATPGSPSPSTPTTPTLTEPTTRKPPAATVAAPSEPASVSRTTARVWAWPTGTPRWAELQGTVDAVSDYWVAVRTDEGELVLVDLSAVRSLVGSFTPGLPISVYGTPGESKFQAMGVILSNTKAPARSVVVPQRR